MSNSEIFSKYIFNACVEIRFTEILEMDRFNFYHNLFSKKYPKTIFPKNIAINLGNGNLSQVEVSFEEEGVSISFGKGIVLIEVLNYKSWEDFFSIIKNDLEIIQNSEMKIGGVDRVGMRFIRMLPKVKTLSTGINGGLDVNLGENFSPVNEVIRNQYINSTNDSGLTVQIANGVQIGVKGQKQSMDKDGLYIDVDVYKMNAAGSFDDKLFNCIHTLNDMQSSALSSMINKHYLETLNH